MKTENIYLVLNEKRPPTLQYKVYISIDLENENKIQLKFILQIRLNRFGCTFVHALTLSIF